MNTSSLRRKRVLVPAVATIAVLAVGGGVWAANADDNVEGAERDRVAAAAVDAAGGGRAVDVETSDDRGEAYEVEVYLEDGTEVDVALDDDLGVVRKDADDSDEDDHDDRSPGGDDDQLLSEAERAAVEKAALAAVDGTSVNSAEASDDAGEAYEVEVLDADHNEWDVVLDEDLNVLSKTLDN